jgi:N-dimethylarginine dimethylaminohydrolase
MTGTSAVARRCTHARSYLMCPPDFFAVDYAINPWMHPDRPVDTVRARAQWEQLRATFTGLGHVVTTIAPVADLPDMVFAANGGCVVDGTVLGARFRYPQRAGEGPAYLRWFAEQGYRAVHEPRAINEGEGDLVFAGRVMLAGHGFRSDPAAGGEAAELFGRPVLSLRLVDPRFYHLDTALVVLDGDTAAYYPAAFDDASRAVLTSHFAELIEAKDEDAEVLGLNAISDGRHVVLPAQATGLATQLAQAGFEPMPVDLSEFRKSGGGPKCCTLELRARQIRAQVTGGTS